MCKKKRSSASQRHKQPPSSTTTVDQPSQPPTSAVEPVDPVIKGAILRAVTALKSGEHEKALNFIKESVSCHPLSGHLHHVEGMVHQSLANYGDKDSDEKVKHLENGVCSAQLAVELLPKSIRCSSLLAHLFYQLASFNQEWERAIEVCKCALKIENSTDSGFGERFGEDVSDESRTEDEKQTIMIWLQDAERKNLEFAEAANREDKEKEGGEVEDINRVVMAMDRRKKQFKAITRVCSALKQKLIDISRKKFDWDDDKIVEYKRFWSSSLSDEKKRGFQKVNIEELEKHFKSLKCQLAVDHLSEAINFAKKNETFKFRECYDCVKKFGDYAAYRHHFWEEHWTDTAWKLASDFDIGSKSADMIANCVWKPVDAAEATKIIVNHTKSESCSTSDSELGTKKDLDECKSSSVGKAPGKTSKSDNNEPSKTSTDDLKWAFCDDTERAEILVRIRGIFELLLKNNCLASSHVSWAIEFTRDQFESTIPLSLFRNHDLETPQIICCLGASQLTEALEFLRDVAHNCGLSEGAEMDSSMDAKLSGDLFNERIDFNKDYSCLLWQELQGAPDDTDSFDAVVEDDGSTIILAVEREDDVFSDSYDIVSWLHVGSDFGETLEAWTRLRDFQREQAMKFLKMFDEELLLIAALCDRHIKLSNKLKAVQEVGSMIVEEIKMAEKSPEHQTQQFLDLIKMRRAEIQEIDVSVKTELEVIYEVLEEALVVLNLDESGSEECFVEDEWKEEDNAIKKATRRLKMQLLKDLSLLDAVVLRSVGALGQYERELASISVYDYRSIIVPMMKSFLQPQLKDLYEEANEKSKAAVEALLAEMALEEAEKKIKKDSDDVKQQQDKKKQKKKKKKKNKNPKKANESEATDDSKYFELHQKGAEQDTDNPNTQNEDFHDNSKQLSISDEERILNEYLENQRRFEDEASLNVNVSSSGLTNEDDDSNE
ncbi:hypothetical protein ACOSQ3_029569 [Xanthoceras sorbifolium]